MLRFYSSGAATQCGPWPPSFLRFLDHTQRRTTLCRTAWTSDRLVKTLVPDIKQFNRQISMSLTGFEPAISTRESRRPKPQTVQPPELAVEILQIILSPSKFCINYVTSLLWIEYQQLFNFMRFQLLVSLLIYISLNKVFLFTFRPQHLTS